jgi:hypothetical protein
LVVENLCKPYLEYIYIKISSVQKIDFDYGFSRILHLVPNTDAKLPAFEAHIKMALTRACKFKTDFSNKDPRIGCCYAFLSKKMKIHI